MTEAHGANTPSPTPLKTRLRIPPIPGAPDAPDAPAPTVAEIKTLLQKAQQGDSTVLPTLRIWMDRTPGPWEAMGNLATIARETMIEFMGGEKNLLVRETIARKCAALTADLAGAHPSPIERLLVERCVLCWLALHTTENLYLSSVQQRHQLTLRQEAHYQQLLSTQQARYLTALRTLAQIRRLGVPAVQVNIGGQQVNVAG